MKRALFSIFSIIAVLAVALLLLPNFFDWNSYKPQATEMIKEQTGLDVVLNGDIKIALLPAPYAYINDVQVRSVRDGHYSNIASLQRLNLNLAFAPLLSGKVELTSVELLKPEIRIETYADGQQNWQSDKIVAMMDGNVESKSVDGAAQDGTDSGKGGFDMNSVSLESVEIRDGSIGFYNAATKTEQVIDNINVVLRADTLSGPFSAEGGVILQGRSVKFDAKTGRVGSGAAAIPVSVNARVMPDNLVIAYNGIVEAGDAFEVQGEAQIVISNLSELMANMGAANTPIKATKAEMKGVLTANKDKFSLKNAVIDFGASRLAGVVDGTITPLSVNLDMKSEKLDMASFADIPALASVRNAALSGRFAMTDKAFEAKNLKLRLDDTDVSGGIVMYNVAKGAKPKLSVNLSSQNIDFNKFMNVSTGGAKSGGSASSSAAGGSLQKSLNAIEIPVDADFDIALQNGRYGNYSFSGLNAKGAVQGKSLAISGLSVANFADTSLSAKGSVADYKTLSGVDLLVNVNSKNIKALADVLAMDVSALPAGMNAADVALQAKGNAGKMDITANVKAMNGEIIVAGPVEDLLGNFKTGGMDLQVKHRNVNEALNIFSPGAGSFADMNKPLDFYAKLAKSDKGFDIHSIKANVAGIPIEGNAGLDNSRAKPYFSGDLRLGDVKIGNKVAGGRAAPSAGGAAPAPSGWSREAIHSAWMNAFDFDIALAAKSINYQGWDVASPSLKAALSNGVLTMENLQGGLYEGQVFLNGTLKQATKDTGYAVDGQVKLRDVSLEPLVGSLTGNRILTGRGLISADTNVKTSGVSPSALVHALNGAGAVTGKEIVLTGFDLSRFARALSSETKPGDTVTGLWKGATKGGSTSFDTLDGDFKINEGIVNISKMDLDGPKAFLATTGKVDLPQFTIATVHEITLKEEGEVPPFKIHLNGPLNNPAETFGQGVLNDYISRKINRKLESLITDKLGDKLGLSKQPSAPPAVQPQNAPAADEPSSSAAQGGDAEPSQKPQDNSQQQQKDIRDIKPEEAIQGLIRGLIR